jgi:hypothetical protein
MGENKTMSKTETKRGHEREQKEGRGKETEMARSFAEN